MKKVVVTGGSGQLGQQVVAELAAHGYTVMSLDRRPHPADHKPSLTVDLKHAGDLYQACKNAWGIVHLAAHIAPNLTTDTATFSDNVTIAYNVMKVAADLGIERVVSASSTAVYGYLYGLHGETPDYLPADENYPTCPVDPYGLSKVVGEQIAASFARSHPLSIVSLRMPGVNYDPKYERIKRIAADPGFRKPGFWAYIDARDAAVACRLSLEWGKLGHHAFNIACPTSNMREPTPELLQRFYPDLPEMRRSDATNWSGIDSGRIERELGFVARHSWLDLEKKTA